MKTRALALAVLFVSCTNPPATTPPAGTSTTVQITSVPPGLKVTLDGKELDGVTPLELRSVKAFEAHEVEVTMPGQPNWKKRIAPAAGVVTVLKAEFNVPRAPEPAAPNPEAPAVPAATDGGTAEPAAPAPDAPVPNPEAPAPTPEAPAPAEPAATDAGVDPLHATWPVQDLQVDGKISVIWVPEAGGYLVKNLDQKKSYRVWAEGAVVTRKGSPAVSKVHYFLEGERLEQNDALGVITSGGVVIKNARKMWIFEFDDDPSDNSGSLHIGIQQSKLVVPSFITWDAKKKENLIIPDTKKLWTLDGLNPNRTYSFRATYGNLTVREAPFGINQWFVCRLDGEGPPRFEVYEMKDNTVTFSEAKQVTCFFMDASIEPNEGYMRMIFFNAP